jgi:hypothetical protein
MQIGPQKRMAGALLRGRKPGILRAHFRRKSAELAYFLSSEMKFSPPLIHRRSFRSAAPAPSEAGLAEGG